MNSQRFGKLKFIPTQGAFRVEPVLTTGATLEPQQALVVGQRRPDPDVRAAILIGKVFEQTPARSYLNWAVWMDATFPHVGFIAGNRGSGKSYDLGIIAEGLCAADSSVAFGTKDFALILFDTQNQFWTLSQSGVPLDADQHDALAKWGIDRPEVKAPTIFHPKGTKKIASFEEEFAIRPSDLTTQEWCALFKFDRFDAMGQCTRAAQSAVGKDRHFGLDAMISWLASEDAVSRFQEATRNGVRWRLESVADSGLFDVDAPDITTQLAEPGQKSIIQLAELDDDTKAVIVAVIMRRLIQFAGTAQRLKRLSAATGAGDRNLRVAPRIWTLIDEAHLVCPSDRETAANPVIIDYVKRGRDAGLSLFVASQQPAALDSRIISQADLVLIHNLGQDLDIRAASARMPARPPQHVARGSAANDISRMEDLVRSFEVGECLLADSESSRAFVLKVRPRVVAHGGGEPEL